MVKHKSKDYKISAVEYYLNNNDGYKKTCKIFGCKKSTLCDWVKRYKITKNLTRKNRKPVSYKITKQQVNKAICWVKSENYKNYFYNAYKLKGNTKLQRKPSTRRRKAKRYKTLL